MVLVGGARATAAVARADMQLARDIYLDLAAIARSTRPSLELRGARVSRAHGGQAAMAAIDLLHQLHAKKKLLGCSMVLSDSCPRLLRIFDYRYANDQRENSYKKRVHLPEVTRWGRTVYEYEYAVRPPTGMPTS